MATPKVFISSTCYDLKYIRENLRYFVKTLGYEPILSEDGNVYYSPALHTHNACLTEIPNTQLFVLIIGGRRGGQHISLETSITNAEYREAVKLKIPIFALVDSAVYNEHHLYVKNKKNPKIDLNDLVFPSVDSLAIFDFIDEVRGAELNNAIVPFKDFGDIENYLRQQWAAMMFDFLSARNENKRVSDALTAIAEMNERIEIISEQILVSVGTEDAKMETELYQEMIASEPVRDLGFWRVRPTPSHIISNEDFRSCAKSLGIEMEVDESEHGYSISGNRTISKPKFEAVSRQYESLRKRLIETLKNHNKTADNYLAKNPIPKIPDTNNAAIKHQPGSAAKPRTPRSPRTPKKSSEEQKAGE